MKRSLDYSIGRPVLNATSGHRRLHPHRRGSVLVLAAAMLVIIFAMTAFAIDVGYMARTKTQLRNAADAASLAAAIELPGGLGAGPTYSSSTIQQNASTAATTVAAQQKNGNRTSTYLNAARDIRYGSLTWDAGTGKWVKTWGVSPANLVEVTAHRDQQGGSGDGRLPLMFAATIGISSASLRGVAAAALYPGVGVKITPGSGHNADVLPITLDDASWTALMNGTGTDNYRYDPSTGTVTAGPDGIKELNIYPTGTGSPGNRGTVNIGTNNNSTANLQRQIQDGLNEADLAPYGGSLRTDSGPLSLTGNPGISAAIKSSLDTVIGKPRLVPIFTNLTGSGANATYTLTKMVGVRVMAVRLTGANKSVVIQPAPFSSSSVIPGKVAITTDTYWTKPRLAE